MNLRESFLNSIERYRGKIAIEEKTSYGYKRWTYEELDRDVKERAFFLQSLGIKKGEGIVLILENSAEWAILFFAIEFIGAFAVPLDLRIPRKELDYIISNSGARFTFIPRENAELDEFLKGFSQIQHIEKVPISSKLDSSNEPTSIDIDSNDLAVLLYTSGTTELSKGVMLTHKNLCSNFSSLKGLGVFSHRDSILSILPLYHSYPLMCTLIMPILAGARIVYVPTDWPDRLIEYLKEARISIFIAVPQIFHMMHSRIMKKMKELGIFPRLYIKFASSLGLARVLVPAFRKTFGRSMRFFVSGGAKLDTQVTEDFHRFGFKIMEGYGLTETSPVVTFNPLGKPKIGSVGIAVPDVEIKILDKDIEGVGEIAIKGPNVMKGYFKDEERTQNVFKDEWFLSGDLGYIDEDGYLFITGRSKELIVLSSGKNIYPEEIEKHYSQTPYVKEMCVMGVLKERGKAKIEYLHAIVVPDFSFLKERGEMNVRTVIKNTFDNLSRNLVSYKRMMGFTITKEPLPRTILGKIKRYEVQKRYMSVILEEEEKRKLQGANEEEFLPDSIEARVISCLKEALGIVGSIYLNDSIELDLGVDSLGRVELLCSVERAFGIKIEEQMVAAEIFTVGDLVSKVEEALSKEHKSVSAKVHKEGAISWPELLKEPLPAEFQKKILLEPGVIDYLLTFLVKGLVSIFFRVFYSLEVEGHGNIPRKGPYILCTNHQSFFDGFIVTSGVPFKVGMDLFFIGFRRYFIVPIVRNLVKRGRIIPVDATEIIEAMQASYFILKHEKVLCIFPEGERTLDGGLGEFKKGVGIIAKEVGIPLVPVLIEGAFEAWPRTQRFPKIHPIRIRFGQAFSSDVLIEKGRALGAGDDYEAISMGIREELEKLQIGCHESCSSL